MEGTILRSMLIAMLFLAASVLPGQAVEKFYGFTVKGEPVSPVCLEHIHPWLSDTDIIIKSIILDYCQDSNWAFAFNPIKVDGDLVSTVIKGKEDSEVESSTFDYRVAGKTDNGMFILELPANNEIAAYTITEQTIKSDLFNPQPSKEHILTQVSLSFVFCVERVWVKGNTVFVEKHVRDENAPRSEMCTPKMETVSYDVAP
jgi:hypothetical protein